ncbi:cytochrome P450 [Pseudofrankia inefficax]|uniref:Cytochrome P450 n=1 Tax=Pseudofrankia inefficax (strain DSM 45817 / CECT 9037 / DDB 130130 / EuI1c) TaxID=298654 RepID=E3JAW5_PSEI1|nr:cytochrome P450 [Pseudofrankia inefficax]ADP83453.1 cytochrome P450 [Pseudofrankia inefficax]
MATVQTSTFDHLAPEVAGPRYWDAVRELASLGPLTWVSSSGGYWAATSLDLVLRLAQDWESFTSTQGVSITRPGFDLMPQLVPIELDPPRQRAYRRQVNPHLTVKALADLEDRIRGVADELIDGFADAGACDLAVDFARPFPGTVMFRLLFQTTDEDFRIAEPAARAISFESDPYRTAAGAGVLRQWVAGLFASRGTEPTRDDVVTAVQRLNDGFRGGQDEGSDEPFVDHEFLSGLQLLIQGGIGTSASAIGATMRILAERPDLQAAVRADLSLVPALVEECIRLETPLPLMFRTATSDVEIAGRLIRKGEKVGLFFGAANRDPNVFERPDEVVLNRPRNRHLTFGAGPHRCVGSNLARLQIRVAVRRLLERLGPFHIPAGAEVTYFSLQARGPASVPLVFEPV